MHISAMPNTNWSIDQNPLEYWWNAIILSTVGHFFVLGAFSLFKSTLTICPQAGGLMTSLTWLLASINYHLFYSDCTSSQCRVEKGVNCFTAECKGQSSLLIAPLAW